MARTSNTLALAETTIEQSSPTGSLGKGLKLIDLLVEAPTPLGLSELASAAGVDTSTAHRLLQVLLDRGDVVREPISRRYMPGPRALSPLGMNHPLRELGRETLPVLNSLRNSTGQTSAFVVFIGTQRLTADTACGVHPLVPYYDTWLRSPLHGSSSGKVLLASLSKEARDAVLGPGPYAAITPRTVTDPQELEVQLREISKRGFAIARDDAFVGMTAIAAPVMYGQRVVGCLALVGRSDDMDESADEDVGKRVAEAATLLTHSAPSLRAIHYMFSARGPVAV